MTYAPPSDALCSRCQNRHATGSGHGLCSYCYKARYKRQWARDNADRVNASNKAARERSADPTKPRRCSVCGAKHFRKHAWCTDCMRGYSEQHVHGVNKNQRVGAPPPAPPGFHPRDLTIGKPVY